MSAPLIVVLTQPGSDRSPIPVNANGIAWSRGVSVNGTCSVEVMTADLVELGLLPTPDALGDRWLRFSHPLLGEWSGEVQEVRHDLGSGTTEIAAQDWSALLEARRTAQDYVISPAAQPGDILKRVFTDAAREEGPLYIDDIRWDSAGAPLELFIQADDVADVLRQVVAAGGVEHRFNPDRSLEIRNRLGIDRFASVTLAWGRDIVDGEYIASRRPVVNDLLALPADTEFKSSDAVVVYDADSIEAGRRRQGTRIYPNFIGRGELRAAAKADLRRMVAQGNTVRLDLTNDGNAFGTFAAGDTVRVLIPQVGSAFEAPFGLRVMVESWDSETDILRISGTVEG